jgi:hypothetical protein
MGVKNSSPPDDDLDVKTRVADLGKPVDGCDGG